MSATALIGSLGSVSGTAWANSSSTSAQNEVLSEEPAIGILLPVGPPDYSVIMNALKVDRKDVYPAATYWSGTISGVRVVVSLPIEDGVLMRSLAAQEMLHHYRIKAFLYPGTSGAHLGPDAMRVGDIVVGAEHVDFGNFFMARDGSLINDEFGHDPASARRSTLYMNPALHAMLSCSARRVAGETALPAWLNPKIPRERPDVFYYGKQGTSTMWLANKDFIEKVLDLSGAIDEDGDFYSAKVAEIYNIPFIEVSTISDSILEFPETKQGYPEHPAGAPRASIVAQTISNHVALDFIENYGKEIVSGADTFETPEQDPYGGDAFAHPKDLAAGISCDQ